MSIEEIQNLSFSCLRCGACCSGDPGVVLFSSSELEKMCQFLSFSKEEFLKKYTYLTFYEEKEVSSLKEKSNGECIFFSPKKGCEIYPVRPLQCQSYPFWGRILKSSFAWKNESNYCIGINQGEKANVKQIGEWIFLERQEDYF